MITVKSLCRTEKINKEENGIKIIPAIRNDLIFIDYLCLEDVRQV